MPRISIVGNSGSGKSTLAKRLSDLLEIPYIELDSIHWLPNWTQIDNELFREQVTNLVQQDSWVIDANYRAVRDIVWGRATAVIWLDPPLPIVLLRLIRRTFSRVVYKTELWNGNRERWSNPFDHDSVVLWALRSHSRYRKLYGSEFASGKYPHIHFHRARNSTEIEEIVRLLSSP